MTEESTVHVKAKYGDDIRRFSVSANPTYESLHSHLLTLYKPSFRKFTIKYKDGDGDLVTVTSDDELREALRLTPDMLRLELAGPTPETSRPQSAASTAQQTEGTQTGAQRESRRGGVPGPYDIDIDLGPVNEALRNIPQVLGQCGLDENGNWTGFASGSSGSRGQDGGAGENQGNQGNQWGPWGPWGTMFSAGMNAAGPWGAQGRRGRFGGPRGPRGRRGFGGWGGFGGGGGGFGGVGGGTGWAGPGNGFAGFERMFGNFRNVSENTRQAFRRLAREIHARNQQLAAWAAGQQLLPRLQELASSVRDGTGPVPMERIESFIASIRATVEQYLGTDLFGRVAEFIRTSLGDNAVVNMLREFAATPMGARSDGGGGEQTGEAPSFQVHPGVECDSCGKNPITGSRYKSQERDNYDLCQDCFTREERTERFQEIKHPWETAERRALVPPAPLSMRDSGPYVAWLQKILTDLGYMHPRMYRRRVGFFGPQTRAALARFQRDYNLDAAMPQVGSYDVITQASLGSILESGVPPTQSSGANQAAASEAGPSGTAQTENIVS